MMKQKTAPCLGVFMNRDYKTCIGIDHINGSTRALQLSVAKGLAIITTPRHVFEQEWKPAIKSPVLRAARVYAEYSRYLGASDEALTILQQYTPLTPKEVLSLQKKAEERQSTPPPITKGATHVKVEKKKLGVKKETSKALFIQLIMEGKLNDNQIFAKVKEKFGLSEKSRTHVSWYRSQLRKDGKNPPAAKEEKRSIMKPKPKSKPKKEKKAPEMAAEATA